MTRIQVTSRNNNWVLVSGRKITDTVVLPMQDLTAFAPQFVGRIGPWGVYSINDPHTIN